MPRLQCPRCQVIVKLDIQTLAIHDVVRCANCHGLIPVQKSIVSETAGKTKRRFARKRQNRNVLLYTGVGAFVLLILLISLIIYLNSGSQPDVVRPLNDEAQSTLVLPNVNIPQLSVPLDNKPASTKATLSYTQLLDQEESQLNEILSMLESIRVADDAKAAVPKMKQLRADLEKTRQQLEEAARTVSKEEWSNNLPRFANKAEREQQYDQRYFDQSQRITNNPAFAPYLDGLFSIVPGVNRFDFQRNPGK